ncbi:hypothetical protein SORDD21_01766 [Streptococcus oralis]|uniref:Uncharacterized protein n=1 Tax=Streptococcus oralis TaxID=1303 RepID=A0A139PHG4_STROR|nr:hypothetical protein SORDD21_01766 [Streptococcus oralis]
MIYREKTKKKLFFWNTKNGGNSGSDLIFNENASFYLVKSLRCML